MIAAALCALVLSVPLIVGLSVGNGLKAKPTVIHEVGDVIVDGTRLYPDMEIIALPETESISVPKIYLDMKASRFRAGESIQIDTFQPTAKLVATGCTQVTAESIHWLDELRWSREPLRETKPPSDPNGASRRISAVGVLELEHNYFTEHGIVEFAYLEVVGGQVGADLRLPRFAGYNIRDGGLADGTLRGVGLNASLLKRADQQEKANASNDDLDHGGANHQSGPKRHVLLGLQIIVGAAIVAFGTKHALDALYVGTRSRLSRAYVGDFLAGVFGVLAGSVVAVVGAICLLLGYAPY